MALVFNPITGEFDLVVSPRDDCVLDAFNGTFKESFDALVTSDGATITLSLEQQGTGDLSMNFSDGKSTLDCTPAATITLTAGTDASPQVNYVYVLQSSKALTLSISNWPTAEHIKIGYFLVPSATFVQTNGVYINQNWNDHFTDTNNQGHISHMAERIRHEGAVYGSGVAGAGTDGYLTPTASNVELKATSGVIYQIHKHTVAAFDTSVSDMVLVVNWSGAAYNDITNLFDITADNTGASIGNNKYFNIVLWAVANKGGEYTPMMLNLPSGFYNTQADAENDVSGYDVSTIPTEYRTESSTGFLIARVTIKMGTTWVVTQTVDLRGTDPATISGGSGIGSGVTKYIDLTDTPLVFTGSEEYTAKVNDAGTAIEFVNEKDLTDHTKYVATTALGGTSAGTSLEIQSSTADGTTPNKLEDTLGAFTSAVLNKTVFNTTDDTQAKITVVDGANTLTLSADIMVNNDTYVIADAVSSPQEAFDLIPDPLWNTTTIKISAGTFTEDLKMEGKHLGLADKIWLIGTFQVDFTGLTATGGTKGSSGTVSTLTDTGLTANAFDNKFVRMTSGNNNGDIMLVDTNTTTVVNIVGNWGGTPGTDTYEIISPATILTASSSFAAQIKNGQQAINLQALSFTASTGGFALTTDGGFLQAANYCFFTGGGHMLLQRGNCEFTSCLVDNWDTVIKRSVRFLTGTGKFNSCKLIGDSGTTGGNVLIIDDLSRVALTKGTIVDGNSATNRKGALTERISLGVFFSSNTNGFNIVRNCATGVRTTNGGQTTDTGADVTFTSNTTDSSAAAASFGYNG